MKISEISELTNTPTSTIRAYEKWGLITPPQRQSNGYRVYETYHVTQVQIVRLLFGGFLNRRLRKITYQIDNAMKVRNQKMCMECTLRYQEALMEEKGIALSAIEMICSAAENRQIQAHDQSENERISAADAANLIHTTKDSMVYLALFSDYCKCRNCNSIKHFADYKWRDFCSCFCGIASGYDFCQ